MRHWNVNNTDFVMRLRQFLPYLWGIETLHLNVYDERDTKFLPYLWGIETTSYRRIELHQT